MPWQTDGTFIRVNPDYEASPSGSLWQKDLNSNPSIKIVASRHDWHDQDLGQGIQECINTSGYNQMNAALNLGGNKILNVGLGSANSDGVNRGQIAGEINYDNGTNILTLRDRQGNTIDTTSIVASGGGGGTVQSVDGVSGQIVTYEGVIEDAITVNGSVGLAPVDITPQAYSYPESITIDQFGRVTQCIAGSGSGGSGEPDQNFILSQASNSTVTLGVTLNPSGNDTKVMQAANATNAGCMSSAQASALETQKNNQLSEVLRENDGYTIGYNGSSLKIPLPIAGESSLTARAGLIAGTDQLKLDGLGAEGTWFPTIGGFTGSQSGSGFYSKNLGIVQVRGRVEWTSNLGNPLTAVSITNLPFNIDGQFSVGSIGRLNGVDWFGSNPYAGTRMSLEGQFNTDSIYLYIDFALTSREAPDPAQVPPAWNDLTAHPFAGSSERLSAGQLSNLGGYIDFVLQYFTND